MAAPYGNKNAEKWNFRKAIELFRDAIELSERREDQNVYDKNGELIDSFKIYSFDFIGEVARELGTFHHIFDHLTKRFPSLKRLKNQLINNLESNCYYNTKKGYIKEATGIVNLKSNHKWTDRQHTDNNHSGEINITKLTPEQRQKRIDELKSKLNAE